MSLKSCLTDFAGKLRESGLSDEAEIKVLTAKYSLMLRKFSQEFPEVEARVKAAEALSQQQKQTMLVTKRRALMDVQKSVSEYNNIKDNFGEDFIQGFNSILAGEFSPATGSARSIAGTQTTLRYTYLNALSKPLKSRKTKGTGKSLWALFRKESTHPELYDAIGALDRKLDNQSDDIIKAKTGKLFDDFDSDIKEIAKVVHDVMNIARGNFNKQGGNIRKLTGWVVPQSHRLARLLPARFKPSKKGGLKILNRDPVDSKRIWKEKMLDRLDTDLSVGSSDPKDLDRFLESEWKALTGGKRANASDGMDIPATLEQERHIFFKTSRDEYEYMLEFGSGNLIDTIFGHVDNMARKTALFERLGSNPTKTIQKIAERLQDDFPNTDASRAIAGLENIGNKKITAFSAAGRVQNKLKELTGELRTPGNETLAKVGQGLRTVQMMVRLGSAVLNAIPQDPVLVANFLRHQGDTYLGGLKTALGALPQRITRSKELKELLLDLGVMSDAYMGRLASRFSFEDAGTGALTKMNQVYFTWINHLTPWTNALKEAVALRMANKLARDKGTEFAKLNFRTRRSLNAFGIDADKWKLLRQTSDRAVDGRDYLDPSAVKFLSDNEVGKYLKSIKKKVTPENILSAKDTLELDLRTYLTESMRMSVNEPGLKTNAFRTMGTQAGTVEGEFTRMWTQFASFPIELVGGTMRRERRLVADEIMEAGTAPVLASLRAGTFGTWGMARMGLQLYGAFYVSQAMKDLLSGKSIRDPGDLSVQRDLILNSGAAGIWGDMIFNLDSRFGGLERFGGPVLGLGQDVTRLAGMAVSDDAAERKFGDETLKLMTRHFAPRNVWWARWAMQSLIYDDMMEGMNPGYATRLRQRMLEERGQDFLFKGGKAQSIEDFFDKLSDVELEDILGPGLSRRLGE